MDPWWKVVKPRKEVREGRSFNPDEFAIALEQVVAGIEAHICVQQTCLDLLSMEYDVFVCADAVGSRGRLDFDLALARLRHEGAHVTTVESVLFELCNRCDTKRFKDLLDIIKANPPHGDGRPADVATA